MASELKHLLVGVDGSAAAAAALGWAASLAVSAHAEIVAANAFKSSYAELAPDDHERLFNERAELLATAWTGPATEAGASVRTTVRTGDPRSVVLELAEEDDAELIVLGRTGGGDPINDAGVDPTDRGRCRRLA